jgi:predicted nuclease with TOPRIM domain
MVALQDQLLHIRDKLQLLLKQHGNALKEIQRLSRENEHLKSQLQLRDLQTSKLNEKVDAFNISSMSMSNEAKLDLERRINSYLKEIDKCLALLNS